PAARGSRHAPRPRLARAGPRLRPVVGPAGGDRRAAPARLARRRPARRAAPRRPCTASIRRRRTPVARWEPPPRLVLPAPGPKRRQLDRPRPQSRRLDAAGSSRTSARVVVPVARRGGRRLPALRRAGGRLRLALPTPPTPAHAAAADRRRVPGLLLRLSLHVAAVGAPLPDARAARVCAARGRRPHDTHSCRACARTRRRTHGRRLRRA